SSVALRVGDVEFASAIVVVVQPPASSGVPMPSRTCTVAGTTEPEMLTSVAVTEPAWETVNGYKAVAPTPSVPSNSSVVVAGVDAVVVVVVVVGDVVVLCLQAVVKNATATTESQTARMVKPQKRRKNPADTIKCPCRPELVKVGDALTGAPLSGAVVANFNDPALTSGKGWPVDWKPSV